MDFKEQLAKYKKENLIEELHTNDKINEKVDKKVEGRKPQRGEIWYVNLGKNNGAIQSGVRPVYVTSNELSNKYSTIINVFPITSKLEKAPIPVHVNIKGFGLKEESLILTEQITTLDIRYGLISYIGTVDEVTVKRVDNARNIQLGELSNKYTQKAKEYTEGIEEMDILLYNIVKFNNQDEGFYTSVRQERLQRIAELKTYCEKNRLNIKDFYGYSEDYKAIREDDKKIM